MPAAATRTIAQILDELAGLPEAEVTEALTNTDNSAINAFRSKLFAGAKRDVKKEFKSVEDKNKELEDQIVELKEKLDAAPDAKKLEEKIKEPLLKDLQKLKDENATLKGKLKSGGADRAMDEFTTLLASDPETLKEEFKTLDLGGVNSDYAKLVLSAKFKDRLVLDEDGNVTDVLKPGEQSGFDAPTLRGKMALLAAEVRKTVPATFIPSRVPNGPNLRPQGGAPSLSEQDQKAQDEAASRKRATGGYSI